MMTTHTENSTLTDLIGFLKQPESYPHHADEVQHIQTHISHVFIAGKFVYKIKKPVNFDFLDYSTPEKRKNLCFHEVELNRRLTDDIYIGVIGFTRIQQTFSFKENDLDSEEIEEYAVKMNRLSDANFLHRYAEENKLAYDHLERVADRLAQFYLTQHNADSRLSKWGEIASIKVNTDENFDQTESFVGQTIEKNSFHAIQYFTNHYFKKNKQLFQRRIEEKRMVDGHGDLKLEHIHITPENVQIYDCIEFNERFRYGDVAADLSYLAMDLDFHHYRQEERYFINLMSEKLDDKELTRIIDFYKCYRAYVKGKIKSFQSGDEDVNEEDRKNAEIFAKQFFKLSLRYALAGSGPLVIIIMGRIGTGKSTIARSLANNLDIKHHSSDKIRKSIAGLPLTKRTPSTRREALYSENMSEKTYNRLIEKALESVSRDHSVVIDATFSKLKVRQKLVQLLKNERSDYLFIEIQASDQTIKSRLQKREVEKNIISDARSEDFDKLNAGYETPSEFDKNHFITVSTDQTREDSLEELYKKMVDLNIVYH